MTIDVARDWPPVDKSVQNNVVRDSNGNFQCLFCTINGTRTTTMGSTKARDKHREKHQAQEGR